MMSTLLPYILAVLLLYMATFICMKSIHRHQQLSEHHSTNELLFAPLKQHKTTTTTQTKKETNIIKEETTTADDDNDSSQNDHPNVLFIVLDDLNDYIETLGGHSQAKTPNIKRLMETSVSFTQAHANIALCMPSRSSFTNGLYPHTSGYIQAAALPNAERYFKHQISFVKHFKKMGYLTMGTGKIYDGYNEKSIFHRISQRIDYGPFVYNKTHAKNGTTFEDIDLENIAHPWISHPFKRYGAIRGSFGPLFDLSINHKELGWRSGSKLFGYRDFQYINDTHRSKTTDELSIDWAKKQLLEMNDIFGKEATKNNYNTTDNDDPPRPFFLGIGLHRPHHPMIVPKKYFDMYPLDTLELPPSFLENDVNDTMRRTLPLKSLGPKLYDDLIKSFNGFTKLALKGYIRAYLASVTAADDLIGDLLNTFFNSTRHLINNTIIVLTSDHGYQVGQKDYLGKNVLWQSSTRIPLIIRVPGMTTNRNDTLPPRTCNHPVSLVDLYPTFIDLCNLSKDTKKDNDENSHELDGHSLKPFIHPKKWETYDDKWKGPDFALTTLSYEPILDNGDPIGLSLTTRYHNWRYVRYANGKEELYHTKKDPYEWKNLLAKNISGTTMEGILNRFRTELFEFVQPEKFKENWGKMVKE